MNLKYNIGEWAENTETGRHIYNHNFQLSEKEFKGWLSVKIVTITNTEDLKQTAYIFQKQNESLRIDIVESFYWRSAQKELYDQLLNNTMRSQVPKGTKQLAEIGDINFVSRTPETDIPGAVFFTRGNILVLINSVGEQDLDISDFAFYLDRKLKDPPSPRRYPAKDIEKLKRSKIELTAIKDFILIKNLKSPDIRSKWLKIIVPDGELKRSGNQLIYSSAKKGSKEIRVYSKTNR